MYNPATIKTELIGLVGWRQNADPGGIQIIDLTGVDLSTSSSGLWFNGVHPMLTFDNLLSIAPRFQDIDPDPDAVEAAFSNWLKEKTEDGIVKAVEDWIASKSDMMTAGSLLSNDDLFKSTGNVTNLQDKAGKIVGLEIVPLRSKNVITKINRVGLQLDTNQTVRLYLFKSGRMTEVAHLDAVYNSGGGLQWFTTTWELAGEGSYFIAYNEDAIAGNAINAVNDHTFVTAGERTSPSSRYFRATAFAVDHDNPATLWDLTLNTYSLDTNFGLNLTTSVHCDFTDFIVKQKNLFKTLIAFRVGMDLLREIAFNPESRVNRNVDNVTRGQILYEIDGDTQGRNDFSLLAQYQKALSSIQFDTTGIDSVCLPCKRRGIRITSVGP